MRLPEAFIAEMAELWQAYKPGGSLADFLAVHQEKPAAGLRANLLKLTSANLLQMIPDASLNPVTWSSTGFYTQESFNPGKLPFYHAGLYYIQEPSAMLPAEILAANPGEKVLDLCAAPGGKSSRLAAMVGSQGLLWSNEINGERSKALLRNLELMGVDRSVITQETPERLAERLPEFFDRILVDAPCSGSGMFRRDPSAITSWEKYGPAASARLQQEILESADRMLKPGGFLVYSTCSFSLIEDELMVAGFMARHPDYQIVPIRHLDGVSPGLPVIAAMTGTARIWPHLANGDGHYCALLHKDALEIPNGQLPGTALDERENSYSQSAALTGHTGNGQRLVAKPGSLSASQAIELFRDWAGRVFSPAGLARLQAREELAFYRLHQEHLHLVPDIAGSCQGLHYVKTGLYLGQFRSTGKRASDERTQNKASKKSTAPVSYVFEPAHALLLTLRADDLQLALRLKADDPTLLRYLRGETIEWPEASRPEGNWPSGAWVAICLENYPLGWARATTPGQLKNLYPPGWRKMN